MRTASSAARIETLESRIAPASLVTVTYIKGALTLTGSADADDVSITLLDATTIELSGAGGTLFHMDGVAVDSDTLRITTPLKSLSATLGDGADHLALVGLNIAGDVTIDTGIGDNTVDVDTVAIKGGLKITGGMDGDAIGVGPGDSSVKKDLILDLGAGENSFITSANFQVGGQLSYTGGSGTDNFASQYGALSIGKDATFTMGAGDTQVIFGGSTAIGTLAVGKKFSVDTSASTSADSVTVGFGTFAAKFGGDVQITNGDADLSVVMETVVSVSAKGSFLIKAGTGEASVALAGFQFAAKSVEVDASASSSSTVTIGGVGGVGITGQGRIGSIKMTGGAGDDGLIVQNLIGGASGTSLIADLGEGANSVTASTFGGFYKVVQITTGSGDDDIQIGAFNAKSTSVDIQTGGGTDAALVAFINSTVSGKISVSNDPSAIKGTFQFGFLNSTIGSLEVNANGAGNSVSFGTLSFGGLTTGWTVKKDIHVVGTGGDDTVDFSGVSNTKVGGKVDIDLGEGTNQVQGTIANFVTKGFSVTGGSGQDSVSLLVEGGNLGDVSLNLGAGANTALLTGGVTTLALKSLTLNSTSATADDDALTLARVTVAGKFDAKFGAGVSTVAIDDSIFGNTFNLATGAGADIVTIDTAAAYTATVFDKTVTILLGDDADTLTLGDNTPSALVVARGNFSADGDAGADTLTNVGNSLLGKANSFVGFP